MKLDNYVGGKDILLSAKSFPVKSEFYDDYIVDVANSGILDIKMALSKVKGSESKLSTLSFDERFDILKNASKISFSSEDYEYIVKNTGMPITNVKKICNDISTLLKETPAAIIKSSGLENGRISVHVGKDLDMLKILDPVNGFVYAVTPGNDPRVTALVASWIVALGLSAIFKPSKNDFLIARKIVKSITDAGYPENAIGVVNWDTSDETKRKLNFDIVDQASVIWAYGANKTVDNILRYEKSSESHSIDHFSGKIVLRHASGRSSAIIDEKTDLNRVVNIVTESAFSWPIGCNSLKSIFDASGNTVELTHKLNERIKNIQKNIGDPMKVSTEIGYVSDRLLRHVYSRYKNLERLGLINKINGELISNIQSSPFVFETQDVHSEFLSEEFSIYVLTLKRSENFVKAAEEVNFSSGNSKRLTLAVFSDDQTKTLKTKLRAHHIRRHRHTLDIDILFHEGNDYLHRLTEPQIHRLSVIEY